MGLGFKNSVEAQVWHHKKDTYINRGSASKVSKSIVGIENCWSEIFFFS